MIKDKYSSNVVFESDFSKGSLQDQTGAASPTINGAPTWQQDDGRSLSFDGSDDFLTYGDVGNLGTSDFTFELVVKFPEEGSNEHIISKFQDINNRWYIRKDTVDKIIMYGVVAGGIELDIYSSAGSIEAGKYYHIVVVGDRGGFGAVYINGIDDTAGSEADTPDMDNTGDLKVATISTSEAEMFAKRITMYNVAFTPEDAARAYEEWEASKPYTLVDVKAFPASTGMVDGVVEAYIADGKGWNESVANVTSGQLENTGFNVESGTWQVDDNDGFDKVINCISTGHVSMPMNQIYGTWEFYLNHHDLANTFVTFMSDNTELTPSNGYSLITLSTEAIRFREYNPGVTNHFTSSIGTAIPDAWEKYTITRATDGTFSVYLNDVLVNTDGGGSNPVLDNTITTCSHLVLSFGTGDKIRDFKFIPYIQ